VQALGEVEITDAGAALAALAAKYEPYRLEPPPGPLLCLTLRRAICWRAADEPG